MHRMLRAPPLGGSSAAREAAHACEQVRTWARSAEYLTGHSACRLPSEQLRTDRTDRASPLCPARSVRAAPMLPAHHGRWGCCPAQTREQPRPMPRYPAGAFTVLLPGSLQCPRANELAAGEQTLTHGQRAARNGPPPGARPLGRVCAHAWAQPRLPSWPRRHHAYQR